MFRSCIDTPAPNDSQVDIHRPPIHKGHHILNQIVAVLKPIIPNSMPSAQVPLVLSPPRASPYVPLVLLMTLSPWRATDE